MTVQEFAAGIRLSEVISDDVVTFELYGYKRFVIDETKLSLRVRNTMYRAHINEIREILQGRLDYVQE